MKKDNSAGIYIVLEGVDVCGKSSIAKAVVEKLVAEFGEEAVSHRREPSYTNNGAKVREILMSGNMTEDKEVKAAQYMLLDRIENTTEVSGLLRENKIVIQERNFLTALVYNEAADTKEVQLVQEANKYSLKPDFLILINITDYTVKYRLDKAKEERGELDAYEDYDKIIRRKKAYMQMSNYVDITYNNNNQDSFTRNVESILDLVRKYWKPL